MAALRFSFDAELWEWSEGPGSWHFLSLPGDASDDIREQAGPKGPGFGSVPVDVAIGETKWSTSVFPDKKGGVYVLPVKKAVREAEGLAAGSRVQVKLLVKL